MCPESSAFLSPALRSLLDKQAFLCTDLANGCRPVRVGVRGCNCDASNPSKGERREVARGGEGFEEAEPMASRDAGGVEARMARFGIAENELEKCSALWSVALYDFGLKVLPAPEWW